MTKIRRRFNKDQKLEIVNQSLEEGVTAKTVAARFDISVNMLYNWRSKYLKYGQNSFSGHGNKTMSDEEREIMQLKKKLKEAQLERDILKKAVGIFSKGDRKYSNL